MCKGGTSPTSWRYELCSCAGLHRRSVPHVPGLVRRWQHHQPVGIPFTDRLAIFLRRNVDNIGLLHARVSTKKPP